MPADPTYPYSFEAIQRYLSGSMTASEMHEMEKAALSDPLLADALDGYRTAQPVVTAAHLNEIKSRIAAGKTETKSATPVIPLQTRKTKWRRGLSAAALIGLMILGGWLFLKPTKEDGRPPIAQNTIPPIAQPAPSLSAQEAEKPDSINQTIPMPEPLSSPASGRKTNTEKQPAAAMSAPVPSAPATAGSFTSRPGIAAITAYKEPPLSDTNELTSLQPLKKTALAALPIHKTYSNRSSGILPAEGIPPQFFSGKVMSPLGQPLQGASIAASATNITRSNPDGSFRLPATDSIGSITVTAVGYTPKVQQMIPGRFSGIKLDASENALNDAVTGYGVQKKESLTAAMPDSKAYARSYKDSPYPRGGWDRFYNNLSAEMGINKAAANKELHLTFDIEKGIPENFIVIETPDTATAEKAITIIKNGPRWIAPKKKKKAVVKLKVD